MGSKIWKYLRISLYMITGLLCGIYLSDYLDPDASEGIVGIIVGMLLASVGFFLLELVWVASTRRRQRSFIRVHEHDDEEGSV